MILWSLPFKYLLCNYFIVFVCMVFELTTTESDSLTNVGIFLFALLTTIIIVVIVLGFMRFNSLTKTSLFTFIPEGLNERSRALSMLYYVQFFTNKIVIVILIILTPYIWSKILIVVLSNFHAVCIGMNFLKIYRDIPTRFLSLYTDCLTMMAIIYSYFCMVNNDLIPLDKFEMTMTFC